MGTTVSVIIPTYRRAEFLPRAVESVLGQSYPEVEAVVVDDNGEGSAREETRGRIAPYLSKRVRYIENERNLGGALARNAGIGGAAGDYITFLDDDDIYLPDKVSIQLARMEEKGWDMSFMNADIRDPSGKLIEHKRFDLPEEAGREALLVSHLLCHLTPTATYMYRAEKLRELGGFEDAKTAHEYLLMLRSIEKGLKIGYIDETQVVQYVHPGERITTGDKKIAGENYLYEVKRRYFDRLTPAQRRAVAVRHRATLFIAKLRRKEYLPALAEGVGAVAASPAAAYRLFRARKNDL